MTPVMTPVTSSNIAAIGYCEDTAQLAVKFKNGKTFVYSDVSYDDHFYLISSDSIGKHFNQFIKAVKVGREVVTAENDTAAISDTDMNDAAMSDKEKIKVLREALQLSTDRLDAVWSNLGSMGAKAQADNNRQALEATKDGE